MCPQAASRAGFQAPESLCQIRQGYRARWNELSFAVECGSQEWTARVHDCGNTVYTAHRSSVTAAQLAAAEFAIFRVLGAGSRELPERLARELQWIRYW